MGKSRFIDKKEQLSYYRSNSLDDDHKSGQSLYLESSRDKTKEEM